MIRKQFAGAAATATRLSATRFLFAVFFQRLQDSRTSILDVVFGIERQQQLARSVSVVSFAGAAEDPTYQRRQFIATVLQLRPQVRVFPLKIADLCGG